MKRLVRIMKSKYRYEIEACLLSKWSPRAVLEYLRWRYRDNP